MMTWYFMTGCVFAGTCLGQWSGKDETWRDSFTTLAAAGARGAIWPVYVLWVLASELLMDDKHGA